MMITKKLFDQVEAGFVYIDQDGVIQLFNRAAKQITGIIHGSDYIHPSGQIEEGDIVLIADNLLGDDDGGLTSEHLETIGIQDDSIRAGAGIVAIGVFQSKKSKVNYKVFHGSVPRGILSVEKVIGGMSLRATIDYEERLLSIHVGEQVFPLNYLISMGHIVVLDSQTYKVKFIQAKGYSYRGETIRELLEGKIFLAKGDEEITPQPVGNEVTSFFNKGPFVDDVYSLLKGEKHSIKEKNYFLHHRQLLCSLRVAENSNGGKGVCVNMIDVSELGSLLSKRDEIIERIERNLTPILRSSRYTEEDFPSIHGSSMAVQELKYFISKAAKIKSTVFITGENGTGKTMVAREIHRAQTPDKPFIEVNCGSIPQTLFESELFGYVAGSFTGALKEGKVGFFQLAGAGTIFLDEISEIPTSIQVKLLHVLQDKRFYPIGATEPVNISSRIIAATNRNIMEEISSGRFREDLYYRLNVFPITIPPLRYRPEDIYGLTQSILENLRHEYNLSEKKLSGSAYQMILNHSWPGNVRELQNVLERAVLICEGSTIYPEHLYLQEQRQSLRLQEVREEAEKNAIQMALLCTKDRQELMKILGVSKSTLYDKLRLYGLQL